MMGKHHSAPGQGINFWSGEVGDASIVRGGAFVLMEDSNVAISKVIAKNVENVWTPGRKERRERGRAKGGRERDPIHKVMIILPPGIQLAGPSRSG